MAHSIVVDLVGAHKEVLDVGCATGYLDEVFAARGCRVTGIEVSEEAAIQARRHCVEVIQHDIEGLDWERNFAGRKFEVILFADVLEHLKDPKAVLVKARNFLSEKGYIVASIPNVAHASLRLKLLEGEFKYRPLGLLDETHIRFFTLETVRQMFYLAGFRISTISRVKLGVFDTEIPVAKEKFSSEILDFVARDPESTTYQFVVCAVPIGQIATDIERLAIAQTALQESETQLKRKTREAEKAQVSLKLAIAEREMTEAVRLQLQLYAMQIAPFIDLVTVTYNSRSVIAGLMESIQKLDYAKDKLRLIVVDNHSKDGTSDLVRSLSRDVSYRVELRQLRRNLGFAGGANKGIASGSSDFICVVNPDGAFYPDTLSQMISVISRDRAIGMVDARQVPFEHPKYFHPQTAETSWCSGACCLIRRSALKSTEAFDPRFFMYCEDVDLSWRLWTSGYRCLYAPKARFFHSKAPQDYRPKLDYYYGVRNGILMRIMYGSLTEIFGYYQARFREALSKKTDPKLRGPLRSALFSHLLLLPHALLRRYGTWRRDSSWIKFYGINYGDHRW